MSFSEPEHDFAEEVLISGEKIRSETAGEDLDRHKAVELDSTGTVVQTDDADEFYGVVAYDRVDGQEVPVIQDDCEVRVIAGGSVDPGMELEPDGSGDFVQSTGDGVAVARTGGGGGEIIQAYLTNVNGVSL